MIRFWCRRRDGNDRDRAHQGVRSKVPQSFDTADSGQLDVHQDEHRLLLTRDLHGFHRVTETEFGVDLSFRDEALCSSALLLLVARRGPQCVRLNLRLENYA